MHMPTLRYLWLAAASALALAAGGLMTACKTSDYLDVTSPSRIPAASLEDPANASLLVNGAVADFECAYGAYVAATGLIGDELDDATQTAARFPYDQRVLISSSTTYQSSSCQSLGVYSPMQTARVSADNVRRLLNGWTDAQVQNRQTLIATATAYEGYAELLLGEGSCATVFSSFNPDGTVVYGNTITPAQAFDSAITRFTEAIAAAQAAGAGAEDLLNMAYVGRARAKLDKGDATGARADAALVPPSFVKNMTASAIASRRYNRVWADNGPSGSTFNQASSVGPTYRTLNDPRVPVIHPNVPNSTTGVPIWVQTKYTTGASPIPIASGVEAQLIVAEADLTSNPAEATTILNASRAAGGEPALAAGDDLKSALIEERRRALFLQGTRLYDMIRFQVPLSPAAGAKFPGGGTYGSQLCMPLPDVESFNNPNLKGS
jgi:starch-binding outer membrane protein, SusD/RagB family